MKYEKINIPHLGICYSCSIVSPTSFLPTSRIIGYSQPSEMRRCSCFSALMRTLIIRKIIRFCQGDMLMRIEIGFLSDKRH